MDDQKKIGAGKRVKSARLLAGLTRKQMHEEFGISISTIQSWEIERNPLTQKGAKRLMDALETVGIYCTSNWLLYGEGASPRTQNELHPRMASNQQADASDTLINWSDEISIQREIQSFYESNKNAIVRVVTDNAMLPFYAVGDQVGGKKRTEKELASVIGKMAIVRTVKGNEMVRKVLEGSKPGQYNLVAINTDELREPVIQGVELEFAAPIVWHRKRDSEG